MLESLKAKVGTLVATAVLSTAVIALPATAAHASAFGCSGYGPGISYKGAFFSKGTYCVQLSGTGNYVSYVYGQAQVNNAIAGTTCNWNITAEFFDGSGRWYETIKGYGQDKPETRSRPGSLGQQPRP